MVAGGEYSGSDRQEVFGNCQGKATGTDWRSVFVSWIILKGVQTLPVHYNNFSGSIAFISSSKDAGAD
jgi:hypothetical protein